MHREGYDLYFVTLTMDPKVEDERGRSLKLFDDEDMDEVSPPRDTKRVRKYLSHALDKFMKRLRYRTVAGGLKYFGAFEQTEKRWWHLHMVIAVKWEDRYVADALPEQVFRQQWFQSGGGASADVKPLQREGELMDVDGGLDGDGRPSTSPGAVGYIVKYISKDEERREYDRARGVGGRKTVIASQGVGFWSEAAKERRRRRSEEYREAQREGGGQGDGVEAGPVVTWEPQVDRNNGRSGLFEEGGEVDTVTAEDRERFGQYDLSARTVVMRQKKWEGGEWVWYLYEYDRETGQVAWSVFDRYPEAEGARVVRSVVRRE